MTRKCNSIVDKDKRKVKSFLKQLNWLNSNRVLVEWNLSKYSIVWIKTCSKIVPWLCFLGRLTYQAGGMRIVVRGKQASRAEAPILVVAPHSTFIDGGIVYVTGFPSIIVRRESGLNPFTGSMWMLNIFHNSPKTTNIRKQVIDEKQVFLTIKKKKRIK